MKETNQILEAGEIVLKNVTEAGIAVGLCAVGVTACVAAIIVDGELKEKKPEFRKKLYAVLIVLLIVLTITGVIVAGLGSIIDNHDGKIADGVEADNALYSAVSLGAREVPYGKVFQYNGKTYRLENHNGSAEAVAQ